MKDYKKPEAELIALMVAEAITEGDGEEDGEMGWESSIF